MDGVVSVISQLIQPNPKKRYNDAETVKDFTVGDKVTIAMKTLDLWGGEKAIEQGEIGVVTAVHESLLNVQFEGRDELINYRPYTFEVIEAELETTDSELETAEAADVDLLYAHLLGSVEQLQAQAIDVPDCFTVVRVRLNRHVVESGDGRYQEHGRIEALGIQYPKTPRAQWRAAKRTFNEALEAAGCYLIFEAN